MNKHIKQISLLKADTLAKAMSVMDKHDSAKTGLPAGIILIVDEKDKLLGVVTDGDIRRALSRKAEPKTDIAVVMNPDPFFVFGPQSASELFNQVAELVRSGSRNKRRFEKIVVVDKDRRPIDVVSFYDLWFSADTRSKQIGMVGLGFVGLTLALSLADLGFDVLGYDNNVQVRKIINKAELPFFEVGLKELLKDNLGKRFGIVSEAQDLAQCDVYFISVGTPLDDSKIPRMDYIKSAASDIGAVLKRGDTVILRSTVPIGTTRSVVLPILENISGLVGGEDFMLVFAPERTVEGKALEELRSLPQVIGGINRASSNVAAGIFNLMTDAVFLVDTLEEAEVVKLINNSYRDVSFAFANEISLICRSWEIDTNKVINAANMGYSRSDVPKPSPGVGGYCLEKDPFIFIESARARGYIPRLIGNAREVHKLIVESLADDIALSLKRRGRHDNKIFILGLAFKGNPPTSDTRGSPSLHLVEELRKRKLVNIFGFDPLVTEADIRGTGIKMARDIQSGFQDAGVVVVMTNNLDFVALDIRAMLNKSSERAVLFDPWALYGREEVLKVSGVQYRSL